MSYGKPDGLTDYLDEEESPALISKEPETEHRTHAAGGVGAGAGARHLPQGHPCLVPVPGLSNKLSINLVLSFTNVIYSYGRWNGCLLE